LTFNGDFGPNPRLPSQVSEGLIASQVGKLIKESEINAGKENGRAAWELKSKTCEFFNQP
jgi:hypothetical protein